MVASHRRAFVGLLAGWSTLVSIAGGCGDAKSTAVCGAHWQPLTERAPYLTGMGLTYADRTLYFTAASTGGHPILAMSPVPGAVPVPLGAEGLPLGIEGDHLVYEAFDAEHTYVMSVPREGGASTTLLTWRAVDGFLDGVYVAQDDFYLRVVSPTGATTSARFLRTARSAGAPAEIGAIPASQPGLGRGPLALSADAILVASDYGEAVALPLDGSPARQLAGSEAAYRVAAVDATGVFWVRNGRGSSEPPISIAFSPADGGPIQDRVHEGLPEHFLFTGFWHLPDGRSLLSGQQWFQDTLRPVLWMFSAEGQGRLLACDPSDVSASGTSNGPADGAFQDLVFGDDAIYAVATYRTDPAGSHDWRMIRIPY